MVTILSIDGGGIRGILPARILHEVRRRLNIAGERRPLSDLFDLMAGTSTGALITLGLSLRNRDGTALFTPTQVLELYERRGMEIFPPSIRPTLLTAVQAFRYKYSPASFESLLLDLFGNKSLNDAATNLLITSFDTQAMQPHCMKKRPRRGNWIEDSNYLMRDAARASAAAPTYFPPAQISPIGDESTRFSLIDGAVFANNPSGLAYVESVKIFPAESDFLILSLGTGNLQRGYTYEEVHSWGYLEWVNPMKGFPLGSIMSAGQSEAVSHQLKRLNGVRYIRLNMPINDCAIAMDDASQKNLSCLARLADHMIETFDSEIDDVCRILEMKEQPAIIAD